MQQSQTMPKRRASAATLSTTAAVCCLQLLCNNIKTASATADSARRTLYYQDAACRLENFREFAYTAASIGADGSESQVGFGECYARGSTGAITTCDPADGTSVVETYLDTACQVFLYSSIDTPECVDLRVDGDTCPPGGAGSMASDCIDSSPTDTVTPGTFNLVGSPYEDMYCQKRTGGDHIVSGNAFGIGNGGCSLSPLVRGPWYAQTMCDEATHMVHAQVFAAEDSTCSGDPRLRMLMFPRAETDDREGGMCALGRFEDGREEYYRLKACTTEAETIKNPDIGPTPAPTSSGGSGDSGHSDPPVDYRGDGDDEDLEGDSDSSDSDDHDGSGTSSSGGNHPDSDTDDGSSSSSSGHTDDSDDSDSHDANAHGKDSDDSDSDDGLSDTSIFAIAFGVSVAVVTCCLAGLLALAGSGGNGSNKVGPKTDG